MYSEQRTKYFQDKTCGSISDGMGKLEVSLKIRNYIILRLELAYKESTDEIMKVGFIYICASK